MTPSLTSIRWAETPARIPDPDDPRPLPMVLREVRLRRRHGLSEPVARAVAALAFPEART